MQFFISYSHETSEAAKAIADALESAGFLAFLDSLRLSAGQDANADIAAALEASDAMIFIASPKSLAPDSYASLELRFAEARWRSPTGFVLPVLTDGVEGRELPSYIRSLTPLRWNRNSPAEIVWWARERIEKGGGSGAAGSHEARLDRFAREAQAPLRQPEVAVAENLMLMLLGAGLVVCGLVVLWLGAVNGIVALQIGSALLALAGFVAMILGKVGRAVRRDLPAWQAAIVIGREVRTGGDFAGLGGDGFARRDQRLWITLLFKEGQRNEYVPVSARAHQIHVGDIGWAVVRRDTLIDFQRV